MWLSVTALHSASVPGSSRLASPFRSECMTASCSALQRFFAFKRHVQPCRLHWPHVRTVYTVLHRNHKAHVSSSTLLAMHAHQAYALRRTTWRRIHALYGRNAANALPLVTAARIVCLRGADSGREIFRVEASGRGEEYRVLPQHFCECPAFASLLWRGDGACVRSY